MEGEKRPKIWEEVPPAKFKTETGRLIIRFSVQTLPSLYNNVYVVEADGGAVLVDFGVQFNLQDFFEKFQKYVTDEISLKFDDLAGVVVTHAHIDHFGGLSNLPSTLPKYIHEIDSKAVEKFEEVFAWAKFYFLEFLERVGLPDEKKKLYFELYTSGKKMIKATQIDRKLKDGDDLLGIKIIHTPGHSPGHICLLVDNVILTGDHILPYITPHQFPESIMKWTGIGHYLESLEKVRKIVQEKKVKLGLPAHYDEIEDVEKRIEEIKKHHERRLERVLEICKTPKTTVEVSRELFGEKKGYDVVLAIEETEAHIEYLWDRGYISIYNIEEFSSGKTKVIKWISNV